MITNKEEALELIEDYSGALNSEELYQLTKEAVQRGSAVLDQRRPEWKQTQWRPLDMVDGKECVLGQLWGSYYTGVHSLTENISTSIDRDDWAISHGFLSSEGIPYLVLDYLWTEVILEEVKN